MKLEIWQSILKEIGVEMDKETLQDLSEDCLINRVMEYLNKSNDHSGSEAAQAIITPPNEFISDPDSACDTSKTRNLNTALPSTYNELSIQNLCLEDKTSPGKKSHRPIKLLFRLLANIRNLMAKNKLICLEIRNEQKDIEDQRDILELDNSHEVADTLNDYVDDSMHLIKELHHELPTVSLDTTEPTDTNESIKMEAFKNLRLGVERRANMEKNLKMGLSKQSAAMINELKETATAVKENFNLLNRCSDILLNEISEGIMYRQAIGKKIFQD